MEIGGAGFTFDWSACFGGNTVGFDSCGGCGASTGPVPAAVGDRGCCIDSAFAELAPSPCAARAPLDVVAGGGAASEAPEAGFALDLRTKSESSPSSSLSKSERLELAADVVAGFLLPSEAGCAGAAAAGAGAGAVAAAARGRATVRAADLLPSHESSSSSSSPKRFALLDGFGMTAAGGAAYGGLEGSGYRIK